MNRWIMFGIALLAIIIGSILRGPRSRPRPLRPAPDEADDSQPRRNYPPALPRRRVLPPPLPRPRSGERPQVVAPAPRPDPAPPPVAVAAKPARVEAKPQSLAGVQVAALLKHRQTLRAAVMLREILDSPLCRRRRIR